MAKEKCFYCGLPIYRCEYKYKFYADTGEFAWKHYGPKKLKTSKSWFTCEFALQEYHKAIPKKVTTFDTRASLIEGDDERDVVSVADFKAKTIKNKPLLLMTNPLTVNVKHNEPHICKHCGKSDNDPVAEVRVTIDIEGRKFKT